MYNRGNRGRGTGRGWAQQSSWRGSGQKNPTSQTKPKADEIPKGILISTITPTPIPSDAKLRSVTPKISNSEYIASYNWLDGKKATILVPGEYTYLTETLAWKILVLNLRFSGAPPAWTPPKTPPKLQQDQGDYFRDPNAARWPKYPTEAAVQAIYKLNSEFNSHGIDVVGCGSTLGNIMRLARAKEVTFRFNVELVGETLFLVRHERSPTELIEGVYGYGHTFPEAYTTWDAENRGSVSHQRLIKYDVGGLKIVIRSEADGYIKEKTGLSRIYSKPLSATPSFSKDPDVASLTSSTASISVTPKDPESSSELIVRSTRCSVPQAAIFDLKTRSAKTAYDMEDIYPRLWLNQTPSFVIAYHKAGQFQDIEIRDVRAGVEDWERRNLDALQQYCQIFKRLIQIVKDSGKKKFEIWRRGMGPLEVRTLGDAKWSVLPSKLRARWSGEDADSEEDESDGIYDYLNF